MYNIVYQMNLTDIYRTFHPTLAEYTVFSYAHNSFSRIDTILGHKKSLKIELISRIFSDHNGVTVETKKRKKNLVVVGEFSVVAQSKRIQLVSTRMQV